MENLKLTDLSVSTENRKTFDAGKLRELADSIKEKGIITPLLVRNLDDQGKAGYEIVNGARRYTAASLLKLKDVPCIIRRMTDSEAAEIRCIENLQREEVSPLEEAQEYQRMIKQFGNTLEVVADKVSKPKTYIRARLALLELQEDVSKAYQAGKLTMNHLLVISKVTDHAKQKKVLAEVLKFNLKPADAERTIKNALRDYDLEFAVFDKKLCSECEYNGSKQKSIFGGDSDDSNCLNPDCYKEKTEATLQKEKVKFAKKCKTVLTKAEAKAQKYSAIPIGYNGFNEAQQKKCGKCINAALAIHASYGSISEDLMCNNKECLNNLKEAAQKQASTPQQDPKKWAIKRISGEIISIAEDEQIAKKMDDTAALLIAIEALGGGDVKIGKKADGKALLAALVKAVIIYIQNGGSDRERVISILGIKKTDLAFNESEISVFPELNKDPRESSECTFEEVIAALRKDGYKVKK